MEVEREIVVPEAPDEVWEALTEPERLEEWFASDVELDARPGGEGVFRWGDGDERRAVVRELEEAGRLLGEQVLEQAEAEAPQQGRVARRVERDKQRGQQHEVRLRPLVAQERPQPDLKPDRDVGEDGVGEPTHGAGHLSLVTGHSQGPSSLRPAASDK